MDAIRVIYHRSPVIISIPSIALGITSSAKLVVESWRGVRRSQVSLVEVVSPRSYGGLGVRPGVFWNKAQPYWVGFVVSAWRYHG